MIVITGPGRTGTSLLASVYREAGVDPGGVWSDLVNAGYEDPATVALNKRICCELGVSLTGTREEAPDVADLLHSKGMARFLKNVLSPEMRYRLKRLYEKRPSNVTSSVVGLQWDRVPRVAESYGEQLRALATAHKLVKDPMFSLTLPVWLAAGAPIENVILLVRNVDDMVRSRQNAGHLGYRSLAQAKDSMIYAVGVATVTAHTHHVPMTTLSFPDFARDPEAAVLRLPCPEGVSQNDLLNAFRTVVKF